MTPRQVIDSFLQEKSIAVVGVSRSGTKMGNAIYRELKAKGLSIYQVNPYTDKIGDDPCYATLRLLPEKVGGVIISVKPAHAIEVVREAKEAGIDKIWMQQGSQSPEALDFCAENGMQAVSKRCIMMFAEPVESIHKFHRFFAKLFGAYPRATA